MLIVFLGVSLPKGWMWVAYVGNIFIPKGRHRRWCSVLLVWCAVFIPQWCSDFDVYQNHAEGFLNWFPGASDSAGLGRGLRMCISSKLPGEDDASDPGRQHSGNCPKRSEGQAPWGQALSCLAVSHRISWALCTLVSSVDAAGLFLLQKWQISVWVSEITPMSFLGRTASELMSGLSSFGSGKQASCSPFIHLVTVNF